MATSQETGLTHAWNYFSFHASQRITVFNFFIVFAGLILAGLGAVSQGSSRLSTFGIVLGLLLALLSAVFWQLDRRVSFMIKHSETALAAAETALLPQRLQIVESEPAAFAQARQARWLWTYGTSFRIIFACTGIIGLVASGISALRLGGVIDWIPPQQSEHSSEPSSAPTAVRQGPTQAPQRSVSQQPREKSAH